MAKTYCDEAGDYVVPNAYSLRDLESSGLTNEQKLYTDTVINRFYLVTVAL